MAWLRIDDGFPDHPKVIGLSDRAFRAWVKAACYSCRFLTDGLLRANIVGGIVDKKTRAELVDAGLWIERDTGDVEIHDFLIYNRDAQSVKDERRRKSEGGKKGNANRWGDRSSDRISDTASDAAPSPPVPYPDPNPNPTPVFKKEKSLDGVRTESSYVAAEDDELGSMRPLGQEAGELMQKIYERAERDGLTIPDDVKKNAA